METIGFKVGLALLQARTAREMTQQELADRVEISVDYYSKIERNLALPSLPKFAALCLALGLSADQVLSGNRVELAPAPGTASTDEPPELRAIMRTLRTAPPAKIRIVRDVLRVLEAQAVTG